MKKKNYKGRCEKRKLEKCNEICKTYDDLQLAYAIQLSKAEDVLEFKCNILLEGLEEGCYTTDFVCTKINGEIMVRECTYRKMLVKPLTAKLLEASRQYWIRRGISDWGLVIDAEK